MPARPAVAASLFTEDPEFLQRQAKSVISPIRGEPDSLGFVAMERITLQWPRLAAARGTDTMNPSGERIHANQSADWRRAETRVGKPSSLMA
jgi:hypothetical protein